jgi:DNA-binding protein Fis
LTNIFHCGIHITEKEKARANLMKKNLPTGYSNARKKTPAMLRKELELRRPLAEAMVEAWEQQGSQARAAEVLGIKADTFYNWTLRLGIQKRPVIEVSR